MNKFDHKWIMYHELHHRHRSGIKLLPILRTTLGLFLIDYNHSYDDVKQC